MCLLSLELRIRRLRWWQCVASDVENNKGITAAFFGNLPCDVITNDQGQIASQIHIWLSQLYDDFDLLTDVDDAWRAAYIVGDPLLIPSDEFRGDFLKFDVAVIRARSLSASTPPLGVSCILPPPEGGDDEVVEEVVEEWMFVLHHWGRS